MDASIAPRRDEEALNVTMKEARSKEHGSYVSEDDLHAFHFISDKGSGLCFLVYCDKMVKRKYAFHFLDWVQKQFVNGNFGGKSSTQELAREMEEQTIAQFAQEVEAALTRYNKREPLQLPAVLDKAKQVNEVFTRTLEQVVERGEHIEVLVERAASLRSTASDLQGEVKELKRQAYYRNRKCMASITVMVFIVMICLLYHFVGLGSDP
jgi:vesicle-associated membrane protein 7